MAWVIDGAHSEIQFAAKHLMISTVRSRFNTFTGTIDADENNPTTATVDVQIDASSLVTGEERRDTHVRSSDFLDVEKYPYLTFKSRRVERSDETHGKLYGELTIHDITKPVVLDVEYAGQAKSRGARQRRFQCADQDQLQGLGSELERGARDGRLAGRRHDHDQHRARIGQAGRAASGG